MDDVRRELAMLRRRMRLQTLGMIALLVVGVFAAGGADAMAWVFRIETDSWFVTTKKANGTDDRNRLVVTTLADKATVKVTNANLQLLVDATGDPAGNILLAPQSSPLPSGLAAGAIAYDNSNARFKYYNGSIWTEPGFNLPKNYIDGMQLKITGSPNNYTVSVDPGLCRDKDNTIDIAMAASSTASSQGTYQTDKDFSGNPSINAWYYIWVISTSSGANARAYISSSFTSPTLFGSYANGKVRRVGAARTDGASPPNFVLGEMRGNDRTRVFWYTSARIDVNGVVAKLTWQPLTLTIPNTSTAAIIQLYLSGPNGSQGLSARTTGMSTTPVYVWASSTTADCETAPLCTTASQGIEWINSANVTTANYISVLAYYDDL